MSFSSRAQSRCVKLAMDRKAPSTCFGPQCLACPQPWVRSPAVVMLRLSNCSKHQKLPVTSPTSRSQSPQCHPPTVLCRTVPSNSFGAFPPVLSVHCVVEDGIPKFAVPLILPLFFSQKCRHYQVVELENVHSSQVTIRLFICRLSPRTCHQEICHPMLDCEPSVGQHRATTI